MAFRLLQCGGKLAVIFLIFADVIHLIESSLSDVFRSVLTCSSELQTLLLQDFTTLIDCLLSYSKFHNRALTLLVDTFKNVQVYVDMEKFTSLARGKPALIFRSGEFF